MVTKKQKSSAQLQNSHYRSARFGGFLREAIFGANDGLVTTTALIAGLYNLLMALGGDAVVSSIAEKFHRESHSPEAHGKDGAAKNTPEKTKNAP